MTTGIMGAITGALLPTLSESHLSDIGAARVLSASAMAGHIAGTIAGFSYHKDTLYSFLQGVFISVSATGGCALGLAVPLIANTDFNDYHQLYTLVGIGGAWGGLIIGERLSHSVFEKSSRDNRTASGLSFPIFAQLPIFAIGRVCSMNPESVDLPPVDIIRYNF
jgi:hypothetical protein